MFHFMSHEAEIRHIDKDLVIILVTGLDIKELYCLVRIEDGCLFDKTSIKSWSKPSGEAVFLFMSDGSEIRHIDKDLVIKGTTGLEI